MGINSYITDVDNNMKVCVDNAEGCEAGSLIVATRPLKTFNNRPFYFVTSEGSKDMNVAVTFGGTPEKVHNGTDDSLWDGSSIQGTSFDFSSASQNHTPGGSRSVKINNATLADIMQFAKRFSFDCHDYSAVTLWIYIDKDWAAGDNISIYGWDTNTGLQVGDALDITHYLDYSNTKVWQKIAIGLDDFGVLANYTTLDAMRIQIVSQEGPKSPTFFIDDFQFEETGAPVEFTVQPRKGGWLHITSFDTIIVGEYDATLVNGTMPKIPYQGFLNLPSLTIGLLAKRVQGDAIMFSGVSKDLIDEIGYPKTIVVGYGSDGTHTWIKLSQQMAVPIILKSEDHDKFVYVVRDDMSGLDKYWISVSCYEEQRET